MKRVAIRGVIVGPEYDSRYTQDWIEKGLMTPESTFRRNLEAVGDDDVEIYVNSPGGSVFSGYEMANEVQAWQRQTGRTAKVIVGALAASAAAVFAIMVGGRFAVHKNTKLMFHGATCCVWGGAEAMKDEAGLIDKINDECKTALATQYDLSPDVVNEWFAEGRQGWLNAAEAEQVGMVSEVIDAADSPIEFQKVDVDKMQQRGFAVAALLDQAEQKDADNDGSDTTGAGDGNAPPNAAEITAAADAAYGEGHDAGKAEAEAAAQAELDKLTADLAEVRTELDTLTPALAAAQADLVVANAAREEAEKAERMATGEVDGLKAQLEKTTTERDEARNGLADARKSLVQFMPGFNPPPIQDNEDGDFWDEVKKMQDADENLSWEDAVFAVREARPKLHAAMVVAENKHKDPRFYS